MYQDFNAKLEEWREEQVVTLDIEKTMEYQLPLVLPPNEPGEPHERLPILP